MYQATVNVPRATTTLNSSTIEWKSRKFQRLSAYSAGAAATEASAAGR